MSDKQIEARIKELGDKIEDPVSIVHGTLYELLQKMGQIDHPDAVAFLMGDGSRDHFFRRDIMEYYIIVDSFEGYLRRQKLPEELLIRIASRLVEITKAERLEYGGTRQDYAMSAIEQLQREGNPIITRVLEPKK